MGLYGSRTLSALMYKRASGSLNKETISRLRFSWSVLRYMKILVSSKYLIIIT